jgi:hypothetical protein
MTNEKDSRRPSVLLRHDDILEMLAKSYSRNGTVDSDCNIFRLVFVESRGPLLPKRPLRLVDKKKSKSEKWVVGTASQRRHTCQMMIQLLS